MKINSVLGANLATPKQSVSFERQFKNKKEEKDYTETIKQSLDYLGIQNMSLIMHAPSFPAIQENGDYKIGTPYASGEFMEFAKTHGFNSIQLGPMGKLNRGDTSPYTSSIFAKNPLFIDMNALTTKKYAQILDNETIDRTTFEVEVSDKNFDRVDYVAANDINTILLRKAYLNFDEKLLQGDKDAKKLDKEYQAFQKSNASWLDHYAVLDVIAEKNGTDFYPYWPQEDVNLIANVKTGHPDAIARYEAIKEEHKAEIETFKFSQFLIDKQAAESKEKGIIDTISDLEVGYSSFDELVHKNVFLDGYKIGCEYGGPFNSPQIWGISVLDPNKLFKKDGSLGEAGEFLKAKVQKALSDSKNIRIDHAMGLVNPYVYKADSVKYAQREDENGNMIQYPIREKLQSGYLSETGLDKNKNYQKVLSKIILPTMREMGVNPKDVVWEDLGYDPTGVFDKVFRQQEHLPGISGLIWTKGIEANWDNWSYIGCHDNKPTEEMANGKEAKDEPWSAGYLSSSLRSDPYKSVEREALKTKIKSSPIELAKAKFADLFHATKNIQISFMDFFGMGKSYNTPGTTGGDNWTLRLNPNYEETYHQSLEEKGYAMNMPEILQMAVQAKFDDNVSKNHKPYNQELEKVTPLMRKLRHFENVLKEEEK